MPIEVILDDITKMKVDAIVNAANSSLLGGGGVDGAIHRAGGTEILEECKKIGGCKPGNAVITTAGKLPAENVIHTVGPIWRGGDRNEAETLAQCYRSALQVALDNDCKSIAFPNISTGIYGYPKKEAGKIAVDTVMEFLEEHPKQFDRIIFVCFDLENLDIYRKLIA